jgi:capsid protein
MARATAEPMMGEQLSAFREAFQSYRDYNSSYFLNKNGKFRPQPPGVQTLGSSGDYHYRTESEALLGIERAYHFDRNDPIVGQAITRVVDQIFPEDMTLDPQTGDAGLNQALRDYWYDWAYDRHQCDLEEQADFLELERLAFRNMFVGGDVQFLPTSEGSLQMHEAYRCRTAINTTRNVLRGVELDAHSRRLAYWFTKTDVSGLVRIEKVGDLVRVPTKDEDGYEQVFHLMDRKRRQVRGVSAFASCVDMIGMHGDLQFAALVKAQVSACWAVIRELNDQATAPALNVDGGSAAGVRTTEDDRVYEEMRPGMVIRGRKGEKFTGFSPNVPNAEFFPHVELVLAIIAANLNLPPFMLLLDAQKSGNFSAHRGMTNTARDQFRRFQRLSMSRLRTPTYQWLIRRRLTEDASLANAFTKLQNKLFAHEWKPGKWRYIEPSKDANADATRIGRRLDAPRTVAAERGFDYPQLANEFAEDRGLMIEACIKKADELNQKYPEAKLTWRDLYEDSMVPLKSESPAEPSPPADAAA